MQIAYYAPSTGKILDVKDLQDEVEIEQNRPTGLDSVLTTEETEWQTYYVDILADPKVVLPRPGVPPMTVATYDLNQLQPVAKLMITDEEGFETEIAAQDDTLELTEAGVYTVRSFDSPFPFLDFETKVIIP